MLIGISGKIGSGKDLVGKIIQYLIDPLEGYTIQEWIDADEKNGRDLRFKVKKFADKLKDIICLLIGCTREQLENQEFKNTELGEEWWFYQGEVGLYPYNTPYKANKKLPLIKYTPRLLLTTLGTECGRNIIHPNIWVNATMADYNADELDMKANYPKFNFPDWVITDVRFLNELEAIKDRKGIVIRIERHDKNYTNVQQHESEIALDDYKFFDYTIDNDGTIDELIIKVKEILIKESIL